jgi:hypothetical protein
MAALATSEQYKAWGEVLAARLRVAGTDRAALEAERIAALWKVEAPLIAMQAHVQELQSQLSAAQQQVRPFMTCMLHLCIPHVPMSESWEHLQASDASAAADEKLSAVQAAAASEKGEVEQLLYAVTSENEGLRKEMEAANAAAQVPVTHFLPCASHGSGTVSVAR